MTNSVQVPYFIIYLFAAIILAAFLTIFWIYHHFSKQTLRAILRIKRYRKRCPAIEAIRYSLARSRRYRPLATSSPDYSAIKMESSTTRDDSSEVTPQEMERIKERARLARAVGADKGSLQGSDPVSLSLRERFSAASCDVEGEPHLISPATTSRTSHPPTPLSNENSEYDQKIQDAINGQIGAKEALQEIFALGLKHPHPKIASFWSNATGFVHELLGGIHIMAMRDLINCLTTPPEVLDILLRGIILGQQSREHLAMVEHTKTLSGLCDNMAVNLQVAVDSHSGAMTQARQLARQISEASSILTDFKKSVETLQLVGDKIELYRPVVESNPPRSFRPARSVRSDYPSVKASLPASGPNYLTANSPVRDGLYKSRLGSVKIVNSVVASVSLMDPLKSAGWALIGRTFKTFRAFSIVDLQYATDLCVDPDWLAKLVLIDRGGSVQKYQAFLTSARKTPNQWQYIPPNYDGTIGESSDSDPKGD
nr:MAG: hypothetical protein [Hangzhou rhabdovirus 1]